MIRALILCVPLVMVGCNVQHQHANSKLIDKTVMESQLDKILKSGDFSMEKVSGNDIIRSKVVYLLECGVCHKTYVITEENP